MITDQSYNQIDSIDHTHVADPGRAQRVIQESKLKEKALTSNERPTDIFVDLTKNLHEEAIISMPSRKSFKDRITKLRSKALIDYQSAAEDIPECFRKNLRNEKFFEYDSGVNDSKRFVIYQSDFQLNFLKKSSIWIIDGTFKTVPKEFTQMISIHSIIFGKCFALAYILMKTKQKDIYDKVFSYIREKIEDYPSYIIIDFEKALLNSLQTTFSNSFVNGCAFHFGQLICRRIQALSLVNDYKNSDAIRKIIRKCLNLSFVPLGEIYSQYHYLKEEALANTNLKNLNEFFNYLEYTYIGRFDNDNFTFPVFPLEFWTCHDRIKQTIPRTTNSVEAWHRSINQSATVAHPNIARFVELMKNNEHSIYYDLIQISFGKYVPVSENPKKELHLKIVGENYYNYDEKSFFEALDMVY